MKKTTLWLSAAVILVSAICGISMFASGGDGEVAYYVGGNVTSDENLKWDGNSLTLFGNLSVFPGNIQLQSGALELNNLGAGNNTRIGLYDSGAVEVHADAGVDSYVGADLYSSLAGGAVQFWKPITLNDIPTSDPHVSGQLYRSGNNLRISTGP